MRETIGVRSIQKKIKNLVTPFKPRNSIQRKKSDFYRPILARSKKLSLTEITGLAFT